MKLKEWYTDPHAVSDQLKFLRTRLLSLIK